MAPGKALEIPRLAVDALDPFQPLPVYPGAFELARNLLLAGVGMPDDWAGCHGNPVQFLLRTAQQVASGFNGRRIDAVAHTNLALGTAPSPSGWREPAQQNPSRVFLSVEATHISVVYLRKTFELLAKTDPRLPATFYRMLYQAVSQWILCYDESAAQSYYEYRMDDYEPKRV